MLLGNDNCYHKSMSISLQQLLKKKTNKNKQTNKTQTNKQTNKNGPDTNPTL